MRNIDSAGDMLEAVFKKLNLEKAFTEQKIIYYWKSVVGEEIAKRTSARNITDKVLYVIVNNSSWAHHLSMMKHEIIKKINRRSSKNVINEIIFRVGDIKEKVSEAEEEENDSSKKITDILQNMESDQEKEHFLNDKVLEIEDEELRKKFKRLLQKNYKLQKAREMVYNSRCEKCGCFCEDNEKICLQCRLEAKKESFYQLKRLLFHLPFLSFEICKRETGCTGSDYRTAKSELLEDFIKSYKEEEKDIYLDNIIMLLYCSELTEPNVKLRESVKRRYVHSFYYKKQ